MFRAMKLVGAAGPTQLTGPEAVAMPTQGEICWIDLENFDDKDLALLQQRFGFHPLAIEDCASRKQRPKIDEYDGHLFVVIHEISLGHSGAPQFEELAVFLDSRFIVTIHRKPIAAIQNSWKRTVEDPKRGDYGADYVFYLILDSLLDESFLVIDHLSDALLKVENQIIGKSDGTELSKLLRLKRAMVSVRRVLSGERDVVTMLLRRQQPIISEKTGPFFRDAYDHVVRAYEQIDIERDLLGNAMDAYMSTISNRLNVVMKQLTILSAIFLPPTFITSFFGQNFSALPFDSRTVFGIEIFACFALPAAMLYWFYRRRWL